ncbi:chromate efflux transporter [Paludisphaera sp.]|uniref:chromate efflux transporter n=1 Tax=Paludisphaera sp. TaxID=2017432 RepID=UPI00301D71AB
MDPSTAAEAEPPPPEPSGRTPLREIAWLFLRLGATSFGGPAAHVGMMEREVVQRRGWLTREQFLDMMSAANLIPGPNSTEMAIHIGWARARWAGLVVAGACFIAPAALITLAVAWAYVRYGTLPAATGMLYGVKPVVIAIVAQAVWRLGRSALRTRAMAAVAAATAALGAVGANELALLLGAGAVMALPAWLRERKGSGMSPSPPMLLIPPVGLAAAPQFGLTPLFLFFLKVGSVLYGSGYVLIAFLRSDLVEQRGWLTDQQLLDAVALGQATPGPVFTTATFIGYLLGGVEGASLATLGIFLPAFVFVAASGPLIPRLRKSRVAGAFLDGVNAASLAIMFVVACELGRSAVVDPITACLALASGVMLIRSPINSAWLILAGALVGIAATPAGPR